MRPKRTHISPIYRSKCAHVNKQTNTYIRAPKRYLPPYRNIYKEGKIQQLHTYIRTYPPPDLACPQATQKPETERKKKKERKKINIDINNFIYL